MIRILLFTLFIGFTENSLAQVYGPNNPSVGASTGVGNNWNNTGNILTSNNGYSTNTIAGTSRFLRGRDFGFGLLNTDVVQGIHLEIEKRGGSFNNVSLLNGWQDGQLSTINNFPLGAGNNRMMVVFIAIENGAAQPLINSVTYGGQNLTRLTISNVTTGFWAHIEAWYLPESQLSLLAVGNHNINVSYGVFAQLEFFDAISAAIFQNVDPVASFIDVQTASVTGGTPNPWQIPTAVNVEVGGAAINGIFTGNNTTPTSTNGGTNCWAINSGFVEGTDRYRANTAVAPTSGGCIQTAHKLIAATGTEQPSTTFNGSSNRRVNIAISLRRAGILDNSVRLQNGGIVGNDYAQTTAYWPLTDTYIGYGGAFDLWGTTWTYTDINGVNFGGLIRIDNYNGTAFVDHMRITVYTTSILPVELIDFYAHNVSLKEVKCSWVTATESNTDYFEVERSANGIDFQSISRQKANGNSIDLIEYSSTDSSPLGGVSYYRLRMVDLDGTVTYSKIKSVNRVEGVKELVFPNPVESWGTIISNADNYKIQIVSSEGRIIDASNSHVFGDTYRFNMEKEPDGVYYLILQNETNRMIKTFQKRSVTK
jgi:hypothetical protein